VLLVLPAVGALSMTAGGSLPTQASAPLGSKPDSIRTIAAPRSISVPQILALPAAAPSSAAPTILHRPEFESKVAHAPLNAQVPLGGADAPGSSIVSGGAGASGFEGINLPRMEHAGTGNYAGVNGGLEPPDQALCAGNGYVVEGVNLAFQFFKVGTQSHAAQAQAATPVIPMAQFFQTALPTVSTPAVTVPALGTPFDGIGLNPVPVVGGTFLSDPRCYFDGPTQRWFLISLEVDENASGLPYGRAHNIVAVSKTSNPVGDYWLYSFDISDDGQMGTPIHPTCPCLGDQPLLGADANGFYLSTNEYSDAEILPAAPPPAANPLINTVFTLPDFRNGQAQVYAMPKLKMEQGVSVPMVSYDSVNTPLPPNPPAGALWSSLQPSHSPPGDLTVEPAGGVEYFLSSMDFAGTGATQIAAWAITNTVALTADTPDINQMPLQHVLLTPQSGGYQYLPPDGSAFSAEQKDGPHGQLAPNFGFGAPACIVGSCDLETLNANDDRMNTVMLTNGVLWSGLNTVLPPGPDAHYRVGIEYFAVRPSVLGGTLQASMVHDGYLNVPSENVLFPSIAATPTGAVVMGFSMSGKDYHPSTAWARLDLPMGTAGPEVHVSGAGASTEDGFTGYEVQGLVPNVGGQLSNQVARWGDYSATEVDENGCVWSAAEYIPGDGSDGGLAGDWGTYITRVSPGGATCALAQPASTLRANAATGGVAAASDQLPLTATPGPISMLAIAAMALLLLIGSGALLVRARARH